MYVYHFVSDTRDTPTDPAGKFAQALAKLIASWTVEPITFLRPKRSRSFGNSTPGHFLVLVTSKSSR